MLPYHKFFLQQRDCTNLRSSYSKSLPFKPMPLGMLGEKTVSHIGHRNTPARAQPAEQGGNLWVAIFPSIHLHSLSCENLLSVKLVQSWFWGWTICPVPNVIHELGQICINCSFQQEELSIQFTASRICTFFRLQQACMDAGVLISNETSFCLFLQNPLLSTLMWLAVILLYLGLSRALHHI